MKRLFSPSYVTCLAIFGALTIVSAQQSDPAKEIEKTLQEYLSAMASRDPAGLRSLMDKQLAIMEAGHNRAKVGFLNTRNAKELLPPEGNDDWDKDKLRLSSIKAEVSPTHPSVAAVSFTLTFPLLGKTIAGFEAALKDTPGRFDEEQRDGLLKVITDRAIHNAMFAMLARQNGKWKIVCISVPD